MADDTGGGRAQEVIGHVRSVRAEDDGIAAGLRRDVEDLGRSMPKALQDRGAVAGLCGERLEMVSSLSAGLVYRGPWKIVAHIARHRLLDVQQRKLASIARKEAGNGNDAGCDSLVAQVDWDEDMAVHGETRSMAEGDLGSLARNGCAVQSAALILVHADEHLLVVEKGSGLLTVPAKPPGPQDCAEARLRAQFPEALLVHRLDRDTSGLLVFARTRLAQRHLGWQFERRQVAKGYVARVAGLVSKETGVIDLPLVCDWPNRPRQMVCGIRGKPAETGWRVLLREATATRLALTPRTGRSHQLRVHCATLGHPILGDPLYGNPDSAPRLQLHAAELAFRHPEGGAVITFRSPPPF